MTIDSESDDTTQAQRKLRIYHGPVNVAGIGRYLADWQRKNKCAVSDFIVFNDNPAYTNSHLDLKTTEYRDPAKWAMRIAFFLFCLFKYDLFHFYFGQSLFPLNMDLPILRLFRKKIVMTYCGSDIRLIAIEQKRNDYWKLISSNQDDLRFDAGKKRLMHWHRLWVHKVMAPRNIYESAHQVFPEAMIVKDLWIHNLMDISAFRPDSYKSGIPPVVVHAPSHQGLKGTEYVERVIQELQQEGYAFEYRRIEGVHNEEAKRIYREEADIIMDQFIIGGFGTLAVEGMYFGKPVMCYLLDQVRQDHYPDVPIVNATVDNLKEKLAWLIDNPDIRVRLGKEGRAFVERYFDNDKINAELWNLYQGLY